MMTALLSSAESPRFLLMMEIILCDDVFNLKK